MAERRDRRDGPVPISESIERVAGRLTKANLLGLGAIKEGWPAVVGDQIASHARPLRLTDGVLVVAVDQPAWATQLRLHAGRLLGPLAEVGRCEITRLEVVVRPSA